MAVSFDLVLLGILTFSSFVVGGIGNAFVFWIYTKNKQLPVRTFILILAALDFYSSVALVPQLFAIESGVLSDRVTIPQSVFLDINYNYITVTMALDRVIATFRPFHYATYRRTLMKVMASLSISLIIFFVLVSVSVTVKTFNPTFPAPTEQGMVVLRSLYVGQSMLALLVVAISYPVIGFKLYRYGRKKCLQVSTANGNTMVMISITKQINERALHIKTLTLYAAILGFFLVHLISTILWMVVNKRFVFLRVVNYCGNIFVYYESYVLIEKFREEVNTCVRKMKC